MIRLLANDVARSRGEDGRIYDDQEPHEKYLEHRASVEYEDVVKNDGGRDSDDDDDDLCSVFVISPTASKPFLFQRDLPRVDVTFKSIVEHVTADVASSQQETMVSLFSNEGLLDVGASVCSIADKSVLVASTVDMEKCPIVFLMLENESRVRKVRIDPKTRFRVLRRMHWNAALFLRSDEISEDNSCASLKFSKKLALFLHWGNAEFFEFDVIINNLTVVVDTIKNQKVALLVDFLLLDLNTDGEATLFLDGKPLPAERTLHDVGVVQRDVLVLSGPAVEETQFSVSFYEGRQHFVYRSFPYEAIVRAQRLFPKQLEVSHISARREGRFVTIWHMIRPEASTVQTLTVHVHGTEGFYARLPLLIEPGRHRYSDVLEQVRRWTGFTNPAFLLHGGFIQSMDAVDKVLEEIEVMVEDAVQVVFIPEERAESARKTLSPYKAKNNSITIVSSDAEPLVLQPEADANAVPLPGSSWNRSIDVESAIDEFQRFVGAARRVTLFDASGVDLSVLPQGTRVHSQHLVGQCDQGRLFTCTLVFPDVREIVEEIVLHETFTVRMLRVYTYGCPMYFGGVLLDNTRSIGMGMLDLSTSQSNVIVCTRMTDPLYHRSFGFRVRWHQTEKIVDVFVWQRCRVMLTNAMKAFEIENNSETLELWAVFSGLRMILDPDMFLDAQIPTALHPENVVFELRVAQTLTK